MAILVELFNPHTFSCDYRVVRFGCKSVVLLCSSYCLTFSMFHFLFVGLPLDCSASCYLSKSLLTIGFYCQKISLEVTFRIYDIPTSSVYYYYYSVLHILPKSISIPKHFHFTGSLPNKCIISASYFNWEFI